MTRQIMECWVKEGSTIPEITVHGGSIKLNYMTATADELPELVAVLLQAGFTAKVQSLSDDASAAEVKGAAEQYGERLCEAIGSLCPAKIPTPAPAPAV